MSVFLPRLVTLPSAVNDPHTRAHLSSSSPFLQFRSRHFKKVFPLFRPHHSQSITKSCQFYLPSISRIHLVLFVFHSNSTSIDSPCSPLSVFAQVVHLDWTGLNLKNILSQQGEAFHNPGARLQPSFINSL